MSAAESPAAERAPVAVVIVSWNAASFLPDCLDSLAALERRPAEVVVVDNASTDGSAELVRDHHGWVRLIPLSANAGFCRANNEGIRATASPYVLVLNPDTVLEPDFLEQLLPAFDESRVGMVAGKLLRFDRTTIDSAGQRLGWSRRPRDRGYGRLDRGQFDRDGQVFGVCGAAALYRRTMLDAVADPGPCYFDESFFAFGEDLDIAWRANRLGWRAAYRWRGLAYHARGGSATHSPRLRRLFAMLGRDAGVRFHIVKNRYLTILRNETAAGYLGHLPFILGRDALILMLVLVTCPGVLGRLWKERAVFGRALEKRQLDAGRREGHVQVRRG